MKFSDYYFSQASRTLSTIAGLLAGVLGSIFLGWKIGVLIGCGVAIVASFWLPLMVYRIDLPYAKIKETLPKPLLLDQRVRFTVQNGRTVGGFLILTASSVVLLSMEGGEHRAEFSREEVKRITLEEDRSLQLYLSETQCVRVLSAYSEEIYEIFRQNGWC